MTVPRPESSVRRITLVVPREGAFGRGILVGFNSLVVQRGWLIQVLHPMSDIYRDTWEWQPDALVLCEDAGRHLARSFRARQPVVGVGADMTDVGIPSVAINDERVGEVAAEHLIDRGFRNFAAYGFAHHPWSVTRARTFRRLIEERGLRYCVWEGRDASEPGEDRVAEQTASQAQTAEWLRSLPKPVGILVGCDAWAVPFLMLCRHIGLEVPADVAIVGVDNDEFMCELVQPPMTSVNLPWQHIGYSAALLVDTLLKGKAAPAAPTVFEPTGVVTRRSSDAWVVSDPTVAATLALIRESHEHRLTMREILRKVPTQRRRLERAFRREIGRGIMEEVRRVRIEHAKRLLIATDLSMPEVARQCGFGNTSRLDVAFKKLVGVTPGQYRQRNRFRI